MSNRKALGKSLLIGAAATIITTLNLGSAFGAPFALKDEPLFLNEQPAPLNMLVMSRDHRMYYEAYNDASDLNGDGVVDIGYKPDQVDYYGYFDSHTCYSYDSAGSLFSPAGTTADKKCSGAWSGDWLNYMTTSRIDALRKVLYGGLRAVDTPTQTVLQRAYIPQDAHSWGKEYGGLSDGYDITQYTPLSMPTAGHHHLFANTTLSAEAAVSGNTNAAINGVGLPRFRIINNRTCNRIWEWVSKEQPVAGTKIDNSKCGGGAQDDVTADMNLAVRVVVCASAPDPVNKVNVDCTKYGNGYKPTGLLQEYGENDSMMFGLISGSYGRPHDGGVLRKAMGSVKNEINLATGQFVYSNNPGIIGTIDRFRVTSYNGSNYSCGWIATSADAAGTCSMWGNPTAEMMYEAVRYFAGKGAATPEFAVNANNSEETSIGLKVATWDDPYGSSGFPHCAKPYETVISDINPSFDSDKVPGSYFSAGFTGDVDVKAESLLDNDVQSVEHISGQYFIGQSGSTYDGGPTAKAVTGLGTIRGLAPEAPGKEGSFNAAAVAYYGLKNDVNPTASGEQKMQTFSVALASPLPQISVPVGTGRITIVPFARSVGGYGIDASKGSYQPTNQIVDFYYDGVPTATSGKFRVNYEDVEQGADHDMDAIAIYEYAVVNTASGPKLDIKVTSEYAAGGIIQHMGYVVSGAGAADGTYLVVRDVDTGAGSDVNYWMDSPAHPVGPLGLFDERQFAPASTAAGLLKDPLWYAAKWGGFKDADKDGKPNLRSEWAANAPAADPDPKPDNYFLVTNALKLKDQLGQAFNNIRNQAGSSSSAAVSSGSISDDTHVYQAQFFAKDWSGHLFAFPISDGDTNNNGIHGDAGDVTEGTVMVDANGNASWDAAKQIPTPDKRLIITPTSTVDGTYKVHNKAVPFQFNSLDATLQNDLVVAPEADTSTAALRLDYLRGDQTQEGTGKPFRVRTSLLGDIVNSGPTFVGAPRSRYRDTLESKPYSAFRTANANRAPTIYVGANDGMLHAFDADTGAERFAFVPNSVFANLPELTKTTYTHKYYVDGTPSVTDAFVGGQWMTVLAAGLNKGGQGVYALDVTTPTGIGSEANLKNNFLWEFTDESDKDLGYTYARPTIARLHNGRWAAIFGNGYNNTDARGGLDTHVSTTGDAVLYIVDVETGELIQKIDTGIGANQDPLAQQRPNGLSTPAVADLNGDGIADYVFAGDLFGNLWKFDLTNNSAANWGIPGGAPLFKAAAGGTPQPITEKPQVDIGPNGLGMIVLFGTGKFLESADRDIAQSHTQSFYGIFDPNIAAGVTVKRSDLIQQTVVGVASATYNGVPVQVRVTSDNAVPKGSGGWYIDLPTSGEMQVTDPVLRNGRVLFTTLIPDTDPCAYGGRSWLMELDEYSGSRLNYSPFDFNNDKSFNSSDYVTVSINGKNELVPVSGFSRDAIMSRPAVIAGQQGDYAIMTDTSGGGLGVKPDDGNGQKDQGSSLLNPGPGAIGRQSWRQLR